MGVFAEWAFKYFESGRIPAPINIDDKSCHILRWNEILTKDLTEETLEKLVKSHGHCDIGVVMGEASGEAGVDFDWEYDHAEVLAEMVRGALPLTPLGKTSTGTRFTLIYKLGEGVKATHIDRITSQGKSKRLIDILADGPKLMVVPPSSHPKSPTGQVRWLTDQTYLDVTTEELPELTLVHVEALRDIAATSFEQINLALAGGDTSRNGKLFGFVIREYRTEKNIDKLVALVMEYDALVHASDPKGSYFSNPGKGFKRFTPTEVAYKHVEKWTKSRDKKELLQLQKNASVVALSPFGEEEKKLSEQGLKIEYATGKNAEIVGNTDNVVRVLSGHANLKDFFWYDEFFQKIRCNSFGEIREWTDSDDIWLTVFCQKNVGIRNVKRHVVTDAVILYAKQNTKNEPRDWFETLVWDGKPRIESFLERILGVKDSDYVRSASKNWWVSIAARIYDPGCKVDNMLVLEGNQGKQKSTALDIIGDAWFLEANESFGTKDFLQNLRGKLIVEIAELDGFSKADTRTIKKTITCRVDTYRASYGRYSQDYKRQCVFVGTTNEDEYLEDPTGGRRFWPVKVGDIDLKQLRLEREQLFAEAIASYKAGATWWEMPSQAAVEQSERHRQDAWAEAIITFLLGQEGAVRTLQIADEALKLDIARVDRTAQNRIGAILRGAGWHKTTLREGVQKAHVVKVWVRGDNADAYDAAYDFQKIAAELVAKEKAKRIISSDARSQ